jgi:hypothetical protein
MSIIADIFFWLLIDTAFGFLFYSTGCFILKIFTFGRYKMEFKDFATFNGAKSRKVTLITVLGLSFYVLLIALIAYLNS